MPFAPAKFEVATYNGLEGDAFRIKYIFDLDLGVSRSSVTMPCTPSLHLQSLELLRPTVKEEMH